MSVGKFLAGFTIGAALGAITGILLAPKSGEETREMLSDTAKEVLEKTDEKVKNIQDKAETVGKFFTQFNDIMMKMTTILRSISIKN